jgi:hypothetical protein
MQTNMNASLIEPFHLIIKTNNGFPIIFLMKINVKQILKLFRNRCLIILPNNILKSKNFRVLH